MDTLLAPSKEDLKSVQKREYRQRQEQARKERIFNPRKRLIGIDKSALDRNVHEKQHQKLAKQQEELAFAMELDRQAKIIDSQLNELAEGKFRAQCELNEFRKNCQRKNQSRDFDLDDPLRLQKQSPTDDVDWLGEDPENVHRLQMQKEQQKSWLQQQMFEKYRTKQDMADAEKAIEHSSLCQDAILKQKDDIERKQRQKMQLETARYNMALAQRQKSKQMERKRCEEEDNLAEIMNNISSDMLTESKESGAASSLFGEKRVTAAMYRGMTVEEIKQIRLEQLRQIQEKNSELAKSRESEKIFDETVRARNDLLEIEEQNVQRQRQHMMSQQNSLNAHLLTEQKQRNQYLNSEVYKFKPTDAYFEQFNTTTR